MFIPNQGDAGHQSFNTCVGYGSGAQTLSQSLRKFGIFLSFTLDGFSSPFIPSIEGDYTNVVGISMPFVRKAFAQLGYTWPEAKVMK